MPHRKFHSPRNVAEALAVSESSVKRWIDQGKIPAVKTAGGHRRIRLSDLLELTRGTDIRLVRPEVLGLPGSGPEARLRPGPEEADRFTSALFRGDAEEFRRLLFASYLRGDSLASIFDGPLRSSLEILGELWLKGQDGIFTEHRATDICIQALSQLRTLLPSGEGGPIALGCAPSGDTAQLPSLMCSLVLQSAGIRSVNLGPDMPLRTLADRVVADPPLLVWVTCCHTEDRGRLEHALEKLVLRTEACRVPIVVGGRGMKHVRVPGSPLVHRGDNMSDLESFARGLVSGFRKSQAASDL